MICFLLDGEVVEVEAAAEDTALDLIRYRLRRTGTKEGCAEGDCGACTVLLGEVRGEGVAWRAVNACILFAPMLDGKALMTVESLGGDHPVQRAMVEHHGSQCGFCTPGIVMSLYGRSIGASGSDAGVGDVLAGNLCRCTGYGPILAAAAAVPAGARDDGATLASLRAMRRGTGEGWHAPATGDELAALLLDHPDARIVAGGTDVGLWVTKGLRSLGTVVFVGNIAELATIEDTSDGLTLGAGVRYADAHAALARMHPQLGKLVRRIGGQQVRNAGTIGGNIANGSPIGDMPPALIALGATLTLRRGDVRRTIALEDYFLAYGEQDRAPGEFVEAVHIPRPAAATLVSIAKLSKRFDSDISAVCGAFAITIEQGKVTAARVAFGGMAGTPARARGCERALVGHAWSEAGIEVAALALADDYCPRDDLRGSASYRRSVAANLLRRLW
ncbi:xanthine dehydrogenase small subunit, partial [Sphingomonas bacterium]|uniref:xanthine dehydrogenase small subunit n=1 Tax=Sphingomonas bacterium TaxID=1895847 RepID=UPI001575C0F6